MPQYNYPSNSTLELIARDLLPVLTMDDPLFEILPIVEEDTDFVTWEQKDNITGMQAVRGMNGQPQKVQATGSKKYAMFPSYYGEFMTIDESEITRVRSLGSYNKPMDLSDLVADLQVQLANRQIMRIKYNGWTTLATGTYTALDKQGSVMATDSFPLQNYNAGVAWNDPVNSTPLQDFRNVKLLAAGSSVTFNAKSICYMNQITFNYLTANRNPADLYGKRTAGLATPMGLADINRVLMDEDLPQIQIYDDGFLPDGGGSFQRFIPTNKLIFRGVRADKAALGAYKMTRNAQRATPGPGQYSFVVDTLSGNSPVPREIQVHLGHNGGPAVQYARALVKGNV